ncbi:MAG: glycosyl transferase family 2 [Bacteroidetes bacterium]|nr:MAG: glycosyl transferase family 2 [Bacteroidota bacterium]
MITVSNVSVAFSGEDLFSGLSFIINPRDRIGLVGRNGAGKSTLLRLITGDLSPEEGEVLNPSSATIGYLPQEMTVDSDASVLEEVHRAFDEVNRLEDQIRELTATLGSREDYASEAYAKLAQRLTDCNERFYLLGGANRGADAERVLLGLGFDRYEFDKPVNTLSGGWKMRVALAKLLLRKPDLMLLDEPTNHLDILSIQWLEDYLKRYHGAVILVSHDRAFLDAATNRTIEVIMGRLYDYKCAYTEFVQQREQTMASQVAAYENQQQEIKEIEAFIERFRYKATKAKQVQSRVKKLAKIERVKLDVADHSALHFAFPPAPRSGKVVYAAKGLCKSFGEKKVLTHTEVTILRNDFVAFVGKNGTGKTTLSRIIVGDLSPEEGESVLGHNVKIGYFAQNQAQMLDGEKTVFETIDEVATGDMRPKVRSLLGNFLFSGEAIEKRVKVLSGGEKARLALAKMLLEPVNLLVLDEPTNHLDMRSKDILKHALLRYDGTLIVVSHDRDFLQGLTHKIVEFRHHEVSEYPGEVSDFLKSRAITSFNDWDKGASRTLAGKSEAISDNKAAYEQRKAAERVKRKLRSRIEKAEQRIVDIEEELASLDEKLQHPDPSEDLQPIYTRYKTLQDALHLAEEEWENLGIALEEGSDL